MGYLIIVSGSSLSGDQKKVASAPASTCATKKTRTLSLPASSPQGSMKQHRICSMSSQMCHGQKSKSPKTQMMCMLNYYTSQTLTTCFVPSLLSNVIASASQALTHSAHTHTPLASSGDLTFCPSLPLLTTIEKLLQSSVDGLTVSNPHCVEVVRLSGRSC